MRHGSFFPDDEERFTGFRKVGFPRYKEVLEGSWKEFFFVGFLTLLFFVPFAGGMVYAVLSKSALMALISGLLGGAIAGPGFACLVDLILRRLRNDRDDWWSCYKRSMKQNVGAAILPGAVQCLFLGMIVFAGALMIWGAGTVTMGTLLLLLVASLFLAMLMLGWWPQVVLFEQKSFIQITMCHEAGVDVKVTQEIAGHADIHTTLMIYTHLTNAKRDEGIRTLNAHLLGKAVKPKSGTQDNSK